MRRCLLVGSLAAALPAVTACNPADLIGNLVNDAIGSIGDEVADSLQIGSTSELYAAVAGFLDNAVSEWGNYDTAGAEQAFFGDSATQFTLVPPSAVQISLDDVLSEVSSGDDSSAKGRASERAVPVAAHGYLTATLFPGESFSGENENGGAFRGAWFDSDGMQIGAIRGEYRPFNDDAFGNFWGSGGFRGKLIDMSGEFRGFIRGRYAKTPDGQGIFLGRWFDRNDRYVGLMKGEWNQGNSSGESALDANSGEDDTQITDGSNDDAVSSDDATTTEPADDDPTADEPGTFTGRWVAFSVCDESAALPDSTAASDPAEIMPSSDEPLDENTAAAFGDAADMSEEQIGDEAVRPAGIEDAGCIDPNAAHGTLRGWHQPGEITEAPSGNFAETGHFKGEWRNESGEPAGYVVGAYVIFAEFVVARPDVATTELPGDENQETDSSTDSTDAGDGDNDREDKLPPPPGGNLPGRMPSSKGMLFGKVIDLDGNFVGYVRGVFGQGPNGLGVMSGAYHSADASGFQGVFRGRWDHAPDSTGGAFWAMWTGQEAFGADGPAAASE
ncbi:MAG: hypothetical protein JNG88_00830 [Phycisphaerales bacterium]|nr:hypothetical protein [Phycisphaerales bacterium]